MSYDNVSKNIKKREKAERAAALKKRIKKSTILQDEIYHILPLNEEEAISIANLKFHFSKESADTLNRNMSSIFNKGLCKRIKRYDSESHPSLTHCYYWKDTEAKEKIIPPIHGMYKPLEEKTTIREEIFNEIPINHNSAITHNDICKRRGRKPNDSGIASSLAFLYTLNLIKREKRGRLFHYWRDVDNKEYKDLRDVDRKEINQSTKDFLLDTLPLPTSRGISVRSLIVAGGGKYTKDALENSLQKLFKNQQAVRGWDGKRFLYRHAGPTEDLKLEQIKTVLPSSIPSPTTEELLTNYKEDNKKLDERIANIEKRIEDIGQKQELQAEMQKREKNEKRLAELEERLHKIVIADTSIKRGILH